MSRKRNQVMEAAATGTAVSNGKQQPAAAATGHNPKKKAEINSVQMK